MKSRGMIALRALYKIDISAVIIKSAAKEEGRRRTGGTVTYLSNPDILRILPRLEISTSLAGHPFTEDQVKVCSIDLRCDQVFWEQRRFSGALDLAAPVLMEISPRRHWRKRLLPLGRPIKLRPGRMILGRTYERLRIPPEYAGKITGRSSYARLGIEISCTCDLINPGWEGRVPLEIINNGVRPILIYPLLPLAQVFLIPLSSPAEQHYADRARFKSKYMNDDGGPSYWWRDAMVESIYQVYLSKRIDQGALDLLKGQIDNLSDDGVFRFERFIRKQCLGELTNAEDLLADFMQSEKKAKLRYQGLCWIRKLFAGVLLPLSLSSIYFRSSFRPIDWVTFSITVLLGLWGLWSWVRSGGEDPMFVTSVT